MGTCGRETMNTLDWGHIFYDQKKNLIALFKRAIPEIQEMDDIVLTDKKEIKDPEGRTLHIQEYDIQDPDGHGFVFSIAYSPARPELFRDRGIIYLLTFPIEGGGIGLYTEYIKP